MNAFLLTSFELELEGQGFRFAFGARATFEQMYKALDQLKVEIAKFAQEQEEAKAKFEAEKAAEKVLNESAQEVNSVEETPALEPEVVA